MRNVIIAFCCNFSFILTGVPAVDSTTNPPVACDLVSRDSSKCYFYRSLRLNFPDSLTFCAHEFQSQLPSNIDPQDEDAILQALGPDFWMAGKFWLHHDSSLNRIQLLNPEQEFTARTWDYTSMNLTIYWLNEPFCALATRSSLSSPQTIAWAPTDCNLTATAILCEKRLTPVTKEMTNHEPKITIEPPLNDTLSDGVAHEVFDSNTSRRVRDPDDDGLLMAALLIFIRRNYYAEQIKWDLIGALVTGLVLVMIIAVIRLVVRKLRRSSSAYFTVQGMALVYVRSDLPEEEIPRNTCTSFIIRGCE